jgi:hypothetical protein
MLTRVLRGVRLDTIDRRSQVGVALRRIREELTDQFGGDDNLSAAQQMLIEGTAKARLIAAAVGDWILRRGGRLPGEAELAARFHRPATAGRAAANDVSPTS